MNNSLVICSTSFPIAGHGKCIKNNGQVHIRFAGRTRALVYLPIRLKVSRSV